MSSHNSPTAPQEWNPADEIRDLNRRLGVLEQMVVSMLAVYGEVDSVESVTRHLGENTLREPGMESARKQFDRYLSENFSDARNLGADRER